MDNGQTMIDVEAGYTAAIVKQRAQRMATVERSDQQGDGGAS
tara:strand:+ start:1591 stop:1716 length:126 start_codon:yes stop_codon:yes gene_type:complete